MRKLLWVLASLFIFTSVFAGKFGIEQIGPDKYRVTTTDQIEESLRFHNDMVQSVTKKYSKLHADKWQICKVSTKHRMYKWVSIVDCK